MHSILSMEVENRNGLSGKGKSEVSNVYFTSPTKITTLKDEKDFLNIIIMMASAGILKGDYYDYSFRFGEKTKARITEQSYTKLFHSNGGKAEKQCTIEVEKDSIVVFRPSAVIPFENSNFFSGLKVKLKDTSEFIYTDIFTCGRVGMGERFLFLRYQSRVEINMEEEPVWIEHCLYEPHKQNLSRNNFFLTYTHQGSFYYYSKKEDKINRLLEYTPDFNGEYGISKAKKGVSVKMLAMSAQEIELMMDELEQLVIDRD